MVQMCQFVPFINQLVVVSGCGSEGVCGCGCKWSKMQKRVHLGKCVCTFDFLLYLGMNALCVYVLSWMLDVGLGLLLLDGFG